IMLLCPKCGDYYDDASLAFCLADGTPLVGVDASSESWTEGARVIKQKDSALRKLKWRRVASLMIMLIVTMVVYGVASQRYIYLVPPSPTPTPTPTPSPSPTPS